jgi:hypothetical protein
MLLGPDRRPGPVDEWFAAIYAPDITSQGLKWTVRRVRLLGRAADRFANERIDGNFNVQSVAWADPDSRLLIKRKQSTTDLATGNIFERVTFGDYIVNVPPPPDVFEMPPDRPIVARPETPSFMREVWPDMPDEKKARLTEFVTSFDSAWLSGYFKRIREIWRFGAVRRAPSEEDWRSIVESQRGAWSEWRHDIAGAAEMNHVVVRIGPSTFTWGQDELPVLRLKLRLTARSAESGRTWTGETELNVEEYGGSYRIVHWELPLKEIEAACA